MYEIKKTLLLSATLCHINVAFLKRPCRLFLINIFKKKWCFYYLFVLNKWLNSSFSPLTFLKLRFWPPKKKTTKPSLKFCTYDSFGPPRLILTRSTWCSTLSEVPRVILLLFFVLGGPKLLQLQNLGGSFVVFFLSGPKSQLWKS